jgi:heterodisulfide reductase subunit A
LSCVVIAGCSPKEHEHTFKKILQDAGLNPFLLQIANIREQCAWVHKDKAAATEKAKAMISAAVGRVVLNDPLEIHQIDSQADVLVVGAGITGMSAALVLAQKNRKVYIVETSPCIGGKVARYGEVFPNLECAPCMLEPKMDEILHNERIELLTYSQVQEVLGFYGNFSVKVKRKARFIDMAGCIGCGACFEACPVKVKNEYSEGLDERKAVYMPYAGALPNVAVIDKEHCLRFAGGQCDLCQNACPFGAVNYNDADEIRELKVGAIVLATGFDLFDLTRAQQYGYAQIDDVYTGLEFERLLSSTGPTAAQILLKNGKPPKKIALVHCVGSRCEKFNDYCSGVCCLYLLKFAHLAKQKLPDASIVLMYSDFCLPGKESQKFFNTLAGEKGVEFIHCRDSRTLEIVKEDSDIAIKYVDVNGESQKITSDMAVLATAMEGVKDAEELAGVFDISADENKFFAEEHCKLAPASTVIEGVFVAGCAQGPKDIPASVASGQAAAGLILSRLIPGEKLSLEPMIAVINQELCSGCKTCISLCPYKAISFDKEKKVSVVNEALCRGCGVCVAACPSGAIKGRGFTDKQIFAEIKGLLD